MHAIDTSAMTRDEWLSLRRKSIGASDAPVIAGLSKYKTRFALWLEKTGQMDPTEAGEQARWGQRLEDDIVDELNFVGIEIIETQRFCRGGSLNWQTATLDGVDADGEIWEFKSAGFQTAAPLLDGESATLPATWVLQAHHQMMVANANRVFFAVFVGHRLQLYRFVVEEDAAITDGLLELEKEFRRNVEELNPPSEFDAGDADLLKDFYCKSEGATVELDPEVYGPHVTRFRETSQELAYATKTKKIAQAHLLAAIGNAPAARCGDVTMQRKMINVKASNPKPRAAYSYVKFSMSGIEMED